MRYDISKSFEENKKEGPYDWDQIVDRNAEINEFLGEYGIETDFFGYKTKLPLGVAAGPLFNNRYMQAAAMDGFSVIIWKTFRSIERLAHRNNGDFVGHNIIYLNRDEPLGKDEIGGELVGSLENIHDPQHTTITNSFGMGSDAPDVWMPQVEEIEGWMNEHNKATITSVVASPQDGWTQEQVAADYAQTAALAEQCGATVIELNFSCPNVCSSEGSIYKSPEATLFICAYVRERLSPATKLLIKIGYNDKEGYRAMLEAVLDHIDGIVAINTIPMQVLDQSGEQALPGGLTTGTCGYAINKLSIEAVTFLAELRKEMNKDFMLVGCGGVVSPETFMAHIDAGADFVMCATAALFNPELPVQLAEYLRDNEIKINLS